MRKLLISSLALTVVGCTPPWAVQECTGGSGVACFGQAVAVIEPNGTLYRTDLVPTRTKSGTRTNDGNTTRRVEAPTKKLKSSTVRKKKTAASTNEVGNAEPVLQRTRSSTAATKETPESPQPTDQTDLSARKPNSSIEAENNAPGSAQPADTADPILRRAMAAVVAKMEDSSAEFGKMKRAVRKNTLGKPIDTICGYVRARNTSGAEVRERPFLYLVQEDEAYIVDGSRDIVAETAYRNICN
jgi:hypothetical protein